MASKQKRSDVALDDAELTRDQAAVARNAAKRIRDRERAILEGERAYLLNGLDLIEVKAAVGHGYFNSWCARELGYSKRTAEKMMRAAELFADLLKSEPGSFSVPQAKVAYALSAPSCPQEIRDAFVPRIVAGEVVKAREVNEAIRASKGEPAVDPPQAGRSQPEPVSAEQPAYVDDAKRAAVAEVVCMIKAVMGYDGTCIANLIRNGLGEMLMDQIDAVCGNLPASNDEHLEPDGMGAWVEPVDEMSGADTVDAEASRGTARIPNRRVRRFLAKMERKGVGVGRQVPLPSPVKTRH